MAKTETAVVDIIVNGVKANNSIKELESASRKLGAELRKLPSDSEDFIKKSQRLDEIKTKLFDLKKNTQAVGEAFRKSALDIVVNGSKVGSSIDKMDEEVRILTKHINGLTPGTNEFVAATKRLHEVEGRLKGVREEAFGTKKAFAMFKSEFITLTTSVVGANLITAAFEKLASVIPNTINAAANLSDELADVRKTTGMTAQEAENLNRALGKIDTRTGRKELREIAIVAGQLGIAKEDILAFTEATDKMVVALGDEFSGGAEEVTKVMGGLRNIFSDIKSDKIDQDMLRIGNALNELGANGSATAPVVADFANRIGGVGISLGLTSDQVLGLSATLQELNVNTERGGTAVVKILQKMLTNTNEFAKVAGMDAGKFKELLNKDLFGAFVKVAEGSQKSAASATGFAKTLDDLGVDGAGASEVLSKLAANTAKLNEKVILSKDALQGTGSIMDEFNIKNETLGAKVEKLGKVFSAVFSSSALANGIKVVADAIYNMFDNTTAAEKAVKAFDKQSEAVRNLEKSAIPLVDRYDQLKAKSQLSKDEQDELNQIIQKVAATVPTAITQFDAYGKALDVSSESVRKLYETEKKRLEYINKDAIREQEKALQETERQIKLLQEQLTRKDKDGDLAKEVSVTVKKGGDFETTVKLVKMTGDEILATQEKLKDLQEGEKVGIEAEIKRLKGIVDETNDAEQAKVDLKKLSFEELKKLDTTEAQAELQRRKDIQAELTKEQEKFIANTRKLNDELAAVKASLIADDLERELAAMEAKLAHKKHEIQQEAADAKVKHELIKTLEEKHQQDVAALKLKYQEESNDKSFQNSTRMLAEWHSFEKLKITQARADGLVTKEQAEQAEALMEKEYLSFKLQAAKQHGKSTVEVEQQVADQSIKLKEDTQRKENERLLASKELAVLRIKEGTQERFDAEKEYLFAKMDIELQNTALTEEQKEVIREKFRQQMLEADQKAATEGMQAYANAFQEFGSFYNDFMGSINQAETNRENAEINREQRIVDEKKKALKEEYDDKLKKAQGNTKAKEQLEKEYNEKVETLDEELDKKKRKIEHDQAVRQKNQARINAIINGISAIMRIAADVPKFDFGVSTALLIAAQAGMTAAQVGAIESMEIPEYATGSYLVKGAQTGQTYNATFGGILAGGLYSSPTLALVGETAKPEYVIPGWMMDIPAVANTAGALEAIRVNKQFADGGSTGTSITPAPVPGASSSTDPLALEMMMQVKVSIDNLNNYLQNPVPFKGYIVYQDIEDTGNTVNNLRNEASL